MQISGDRLDAAVKQAMCHGSIQQAAYNAAVENPVVPL
jgi:hypothetical protein